MVRRAYTVLIVPKRRGATDDARGVAKPAPAEPTVPRCLARAIRDYAPSATGTSDTASVACASDVSDTDDAPETDDGEMGAWLARLRTA